MKSSTTSFHWKKGRKKILSKEEFFNEKQKTGRYTSGRNNGFIHELDADHQHRKQHRIKRSRQKRQQLQMQMQGMHLQILIFRQEDLILSVRGQLVAVRI